MPRGLSSDSTHARRAARAVRRTSSGSGETVCALSGRTSLVDASSADDSWPSGDCSSICNADWVDAAGAAASANTTSAREAAGSDSAGKASRLVVLVGVNSGGGSTWAGSLGAGFSISVSAPVVAVSTLPLAIFDPASPVEVNSLSAPRSGAASVPFASTVKSSPAAACGFGVLSGGADCGDTAHAPARRSSGSVRLFLVRPRARLVRSVNSLWSSELLPGRDSVRSTFPGATCRSGGRATALCSIWPKASLAGLVRRPTTNSAAGGSAGDDFRAARENGEFMAQASWGPWSGKDRSATAR